MVKNDQKTLGRAWAGLGVPCAWLGRPWAWGAWPNTARVLLVLGPDRASGLAALAQHSSLGTAGSGR